VNVGRQEPQPEYGPVICQRGICAQSDADGRSTMAEHNSASATRQRIPVSDGTELSFITAGEASKPAVLLPHGTPNSARMFWEVAPALG
jgi:hypothetical protein